MKSLFLGALEDLNLMRFNH